MAKRQYRVRTPRKDWDDDDDRSSGGGGGRVITSGHVWAFIIMGFLLVTFVMSQIGPTSAGGGNGYGGGGWRIESVYKGAVQVMNTETGEMRQVRDASLVKKCLSGSLKRGDVISLD